MYHKPLWHWYKIYWYILGAISIYCNMAIQSVNTQNLLIGYLGKGFLYKTCFDHVRMPFARNDLFDCVKHFVHIGPFNGLSRVLRQATARTDTDLVFIGPEERNPVKYESYTRIFFQAIAFKNAVNKISAILFMRQSVHLSRPSAGPRLNIKTVLSTYGDFHVKDKTAVRTSYL